MTQNIDEEIENLINPKKKPGLNWLEILLVIILVLIIFTWLVSPRITARNNEKDLELFLDFINKTTGIPTLGGDAFIPIGYTLDNLNYFKSVVKDQVGGGKQNVMVYTDPKTCREKCFSCVFSMFEKVFICYRYNENNLEEDIQKEWEFIKQQSNLTSLPRSLYPKLSQS